MKRLLFALLVIGAQPLFACVPRIEVTPPRPRVGEAIEIAMNGACGCSAVPYNPKVTVNPGVIAVDLEQYTGGCLTIITEWGERVRAQGAPAGEYAVVVRSNGEELARTSVTVRDHPFRLIPTFGDPGTEVAIGHKDIFCESFPCEPVVTFGGAPATSVRVRTDGHLIATAPEHAAGLVDVVVTMPQGTTLTARQAYLYPAFGADLTTEHERVLFPIAFEGPGAHGSLWTTDNVAANDGPIRAAALATTVPAGGSVRLPVTSGDGGMFLYAPRGMERWLTYASHIVDRARRSLNAGTEMRVVFEHETGPYLRIANVALTAESRQTLRIYDLDVVPDRAVRVLITPAGRAPVQVTARLMGGIVCVVPPCYQPRPTFAVINLDAIPELAGAASATIDIQPADVHRRDLRLWAFVSVTNNDTQHVTTYTPQHRRRAALLP